MARKIYAMKTPSWFYTGNSIRKLCRTLTTKGLNLDGVRYEVYDYDTEQFITWIKYDMENDVWYKFIPDHVEPECIPVRKVMTIFVPELTFKAIYKESVSWVDNPVKAKWQVMNGTRNLKANRPPTYSKNDIRYTTEESDEDD